MSEITSDFKPSGELRWARYTFPDGNIRSVLQHAWKRERWTYDGDGLGKTTFVDVEWRDVPVWHVPYEPAK